MFQLLVTPQANSSAGGMISILRQRFLEYTDAVISGQIGSLSRDSVECIRSWPCILMEEGREGEVAHLALIKAVDGSGGDPKVSLDAIPTRPALTNEAIWKMRAELGIEDFEFHRHHWAIKDRDLLAALAAHGVMLVDPEKRLQVSSRPLPAPSRGTLISAIDVIGKWGHTAIDRFLLEAGEVGLKAGRDVGSCQNRANAIIEFATKNPSVKTADDSLLSVFIARKTHLSAETTPAPKRLTSHFRYVKQLPGGGYADVWIAFDEELQREVAIKIIRASMSTYDGFARDQARALARAAHPNIVTVYSVGEVPDPSDASKAVTGIVMEYVQGETLNDVFQRAVNAQKARSIGSAIISAVGWMHQKALQHGDLHGDNVLVTAEGTVKVIDILYLDSLKLLGTMQRAESQEKDLRAIRFMLERLIDCARVGPDAATRFGAACHGNLSTEGLQLAFANALTDGAATAAASATSKPRAESVGDETSDKTERDVLVLLLHLRRDGNRLTVRKPPHMPPIVSIGNENYYQTGNPGLSQSFADAVQWMATKGLLRLDGSSSGFRILDSLNIPASDADFYKISDAGYKWMREKGAIK